MMKFKSTTEENSNSQKKNRNINRLHYAKPTNFREKSSGIVRNLILKSKTKMFPKFRSRLIQSLELSN